MLFKLRRKEVPWEVVDNKAVEPVPNYYDEDKDLDIVSIGETASGTYVFHVKQLSDAAELRNAVVFARQSLMQEIAKRGYNVLDQLEYDPLSTRQKASSAGQLQRAA